MTQIASFDIVHYYFEKHEHKVYGAILCSFFGGLVVGPTLVEHLMQKLSYKFMLIVLAAVNTANIPTAFVYRGSCLTNSHANEGHQLMTEVKAETSSSHDKDDAEDALMEVCDTSNDEATSGDVTDISPTLNQDDDVKTGNLKSIIHTHLSLLLQPQFILGMLHYLLSSVGDNTFFALTVSYTVDQAILTSAEAALGMTITGGSMVVGSLALTIASHWQLNRLLINSVSEAVYGLSILLLPVTSGLYATYALMIIFGLANSIYATNTLSYIAQEFGSEQHFVAKVAYMLSAVGVGSLIGPVLSGYIASHAGYQVAFYFAGCSPIVGSAMLMAGWICKRTKGCQQWRHKQAEVSE